MQSFKTTQLPRLVRGKPHAWDPNLCLAWAKSFFAFLRTSIANHPSSNASALANGAGPDTIADGGAGIAGKVEDLRERRVWRVTFHPGKGAQMLLLDDEGEADVQNGEDRVGFLPQWYWDEVALQSNVTAQN